MCLFYIPFWRLFSLDTEFSVNTFFISALKHVILALIFLREVLFICIIVLPYIMFFFLFPLSIVLLHLWFSAGWLGCAQLLNFWTRMPTFLNLYVNCFLSTKFGRCSDISLKIIFHIFVLILPSCTPITHTVHSLTCHRCSQICVLQLATLYRQLSKFTAVSNLL